MCDQKVSLGFVGDVFGVTAQVDCRLTKVTLLTGSSGLNNSAENLGRHNLPPLNRISSRDSTIRVEQHFLTR
jgi:hypothetical protein